MGTGMRMNDECVDAVSFPNWHFAEANIGQTRQVCSIFHCQTPVGTVPYWYDDPDHPQRALPLLQSMSPIVLGDYGAVLARGRNKTIFVALCKVIDDLPDPLVTVQVIHWIESRFKPTDEITRMVIKQGLHAIELYHKQRRRDFDFVFQMLCGADPAP